MRNTLVDTGLAVLVSAVCAWAQPSLMEPPEFPDTVPGPAANHPGTTCFHLAHGMIEPGDVDWVQVTIGIATERTVVDVDFTGDESSALLASVVGGSSGFNIDDGNNAIDAFCGLSGDTDPLGSLGDSAASVGATPRGAVIDIGVTGAEDAGFNGSHARSFEYDVWVYVLPVPCVQDADCDDGIDCTTDTCQAKTGFCENAPNDAFCDNGIFCDGMEICDALAGCRPGDAPICDDGIDCTIDSCDPALDACTAATDDAACDDGSYCNGAETCDASQGCLAGDDPCSGSLCDEGGDRCVECLTDAHCDDGVDCTVDMCDAASGDCAASPSDAACDDGLYCNGAETCDVSQGCLAGDEPCSGGLCDEGGDRCVECLTDADCDDGIDCTTDICDAKLNTCLIAPGDAACDDGLFCNGMETCHPTQGCLAGPEPCPDGFCDENGERCFECLTDADCDDGVFCNGAEMCDTAGSCAPGENPCEPGQVCDPATDQCVAGTAGLALDINVGACPNRFRPDGRGWLHAVLVAKDGFDVGLVDIASLRLSRTDGIGGFVTPVEGPPGPHTVMTDLTAPSPDGPCNCDVLPADGWPDLMMKFDGRDVADGLLLADEPHDAVIELSVSGTLADGTAFAVTDCVTIKEVKRAGR